MRVVTATLLAIVALAIAGLAATVEVASARDGCGNGRYWNGYRCASYGYRSYYRPYGYRPYYGTYGYARPYRRNPDWNPYYSTSRRCPPYYTVQDGRCKPYRGY